MICGRLCMGKVESFNTTVPAKWYTLFFLLSSSLHVPFLSLV